MLTVHSSQNSHEEDASYLRYAGAERRKEQGKGMCFRSIDKRPEVEYIFLMLDEKFIFKDAAFKHGIVEADILNAFEQRLFDHVLSGEEHKNLLIGLDRNGNPLEIMYNVIEGEVINVFHAMKCRNAYQKLLN